MGRQMEPGDEQPELEAKSNSHLGVRHGDQEGWVLQASKSSAVFRLARCESKE